MGWTGSKLFGGILIMCLLVPAGASVAMPGWVKKGMRATDKAVYFTGVGTHDVLEKAEQAAIDHAMAKALAFIGERFSAPRVIERDEEGLRARRTLESRSETVLLREQRVTKRHVRRARDGRYEVFVQIGYPRHVLYRVKAEQEKALRKARASLETVLGLAQAAWRRGDASTALNYLSQARERVGFLDDTILEDRVESMADEWISDIQIMVISGDGQRLTVGLPPLKPVRVKVSTRYNVEVPLAGVPLRLRWNKEPWQALGVSGPNGILDLTSWVQASGTGTLLGEVAVDWSALGLDPTVATIGSAQLVLKVASKPRTQRVALRIDERLEGERINRSFLAEAMRQALVAAGFRVIANSIGFGTLERADEKVMDKADIIIAGWLESSPRSDNDGWVVSAQTNGMLQALDPRTGVTLVQIRKKGQVTFGETLKAAAEEGRETVSSELAKEMLRRLVIRIEEEVESVADETTGGR